MTDSASPASQQVADLRDWITKDRARVDRKPTAKRRYAALTYDGATCVTTPEDAMSILIDTDGSVAYDLDERWMTEAEFEAMGEFHGW